MLDVIGEKNLIEEGWISGCKDSEAELATVGRMKWGSERVWGKSLAIGRKSGGW